MPDTHSDLAYANLEEGKLGSDSFTLRDIVRPLAKFSSLSKAASKTPAAALAACS